jgi:predicted AlkP superfamily phosphohydrolase/phosphomutase
MPAPDGRVVAVGLDAAQWSLVESMIDAGEMPRLAALRERAAVARLRHADYRSGLVWEHFLRGRGVDGCGRASVVEFDPGDYSVTKLGALPEPPFFAGVDGRTICFDVPYVSLASVPRDTVAVTAWGAHDPGYPRASVPPGLLTQIDELFAPHPAFDNDYAIVWHRPEAMEALVHALVRGVRHRAEIACWLLDRFPDWKLFVTVLSEPHSAAEQLWHGIARDYPVGAVVDAGIAEAHLRDVYRAVDASVGLLVDALPPDTTVVLFSMHGTGTNDADVASMVLLPELLHRLHTGQPFLREVDTEAWAAAGHPLVVPPPDQSWDVTLKHRLPPVPRAPAPPGPTYLRRALHRLRRATSRGASGSVGALGMPIAPETDADPTAIGIPHDPIEWQVATRYRPWWPGMRAFALPTFYDGRVRINLEGRERAGVVPRAGYEQACAEVEAVLDACRDARTGERVVADVVRLRADDPLAPGGPDADLQIIWSRPSDAFTHPDAGTIGPFPFRRTGGHTPDGFAFVLGPDIDPVDLGEHDALAITATVATLAGADADGLDAPPLPVPTAGTR